MIFKLFNTDYDFEYTCSIFKQKAIIFFALLLFADVNCIQREKCSSVKKKYCMGVRSFSYVDWVNKSSLSRKQIFCSLREFNLDFGLSLVVFKLLQKLFMSCVTTAVRNIEEVCDELKCFQQNNLIFMTSPHTTSFRKVF